MPPKAKAKKSAAQAKRAAADNETEAPQQKPQQLPQQQNQQTPAAAPPQQQQQQQQQPLDIIQDFFRGPISTRPDIGIESEPVPTLAAVEAADHQRQRNCPTLFGGGMSARFFPQRDDALRHSSYVATTVVPPQLFQQQQGAASSITGQYELISPICVDTAAGTGAKLFTVMPTAGIFPFVRDQLTSRRNFYALVSPEAPLDLFFDIDATLSADDIRHWCGIVMPYAVAAPTAVFNHNHHNNNHAHGGNDDDDDERLLPFVGTQLSANEQFALSFQKACDNALVSVVHGLWRNIKRKLMFCERESASGGEIALDHLAVFDSCNRDTKKMSFHIHMRLWDKKNQRPAVFPNVRVMNQFVHELMQACTTEPDDFDLPMGRYWASYVDTAVYTSWRAFRFPFCSKRMRDGKSGVPLLPRLAAASIASATGVVEAMLAKFAEEAEKMHLQLEQQQQQQTETVASQSFFISPVLAALSPAEQKTFLQKIFVSALQEIHVANLQHGAVLPFASADGGMEGRLAAALRDPVAVSRFWQSLDMSLIARPETRPRRIGAPPLPTTYIFEDVATAMSAHQFQPRLAAAGMMRRRAGDAEEDDDAAEDDAEALFDPREFLPATAAGSGAAAVAGAAVAAGAGGAGGGPGSAAARRYLINIKDLPIGQKQRVHPSSPVGLLLLQVFKSIHPNFDNSLTRVSRADFWTNNYIRGYYVFQKQSRYCPRLGRNHKSSYVSLYITYGSIKVKCYSDDCHDKKCHVIAWLPNTAQAEGLRMSARDTLLPDLGLHEVARRYGPIVVAAPAPEQPQQAAGEGDDEQQQQQQQQVSNDDAQSNPPSRTSEGGGGGDENVVHGGGGDDAANDDEKSKNKGVNNNGAAVVSAAPIFPSRETLAAIIAEEQVELMREQGFYDEVVARSTRRQTAVARQQQVSPDDVVSSGVAVDQQQQTSSSVSMLHLHSRDTEAAPVDYAELLGMDLSQKE